jgi:hypothetical protein
MTMLLLWDFTLCRLVGEISTFRRNIFIRNVGIYVQVHTVLQLEHQHVYYKLRVHSCLNSCSLSAILCFKKIKREKSFFRTRNLHKNHKYPYTFKLVADFNSALCICSQIADIKSWKSLSSSIFVPQRRLNRCHHLTRLINWQRRYQRENSLRTYIKARHCCKK